MGLKITSRLIDWFFWTVFLSLSFIFLFDISSTGLQSLAINGYTTIWDSLKLLASTFSIDFLQGNDWDFEFSVIYYSVFWDDIRALFVESILFISILFILLYTTGDWRGINFILKVILMLLWFSVFILAVSQFLNYGSTLSGFFNTSYGISILKGLILLINISLLLELRSNLATFSVLKQEVAFLLLCFIWALISLISSDDLFLIYLLFETLSFIVCLLLVSLSSRQVRVESGVKYFILNGVASILFCLGVVLTYLNYNTTKIAEILSSVGELGEDFIFLILLCISIAFLGKLGTAPFSIWLIDIYSISSFTIIGFLLIPLKLSIFIVFIKLYYSIFLEYLHLWQSTLLLIGVFSLIYGCLGALNQFQVKRFIAWTTINQAGYLLIGLALGTVGSFSILLNYFLIYSISSLGLILCLIYGSRSLGVELIYFRDIQIVFNRNKWLALTLSILMFSFAGIPPLAGFYAKYLLLVGIEEQSFYSILIIVLIASLASAFYYIRFVRLCFIKFDLSNKSNQFNYYNWSTTLFISSILIFIIGFSFIQGEVIQACFFIAQESFINQWKIFCL